MLKRSFLRSISAQRALSSQSDAPCLSLGQWQFSDYSFFSVRLRSDSSHQRLHSDSSHVRLCSDSTHLRLRSDSSPCPAHMMVLSAVAVDIVSKLLKGGACVSPLRLLKDWTAPPSLSSDHWLVLKPLYIISALAWLASLCGVLTSF